MSEERDFDTNNLCIAVTEDAFEKFQANIVPMVETSITVPFDGSPPPDTEAEAISATEISSDNEVVSSTNPDPMEEDECLPLVYFHSTEYDNQVVINTENQNPVAIPENIPGSVVCEKNDEGISTSLSHVDRSQNITSDYLDTNNSFESNLGTSDDYDSLQKTVSKRGRKKKTINNDNLEMVIPEIKTPKKRGRNQKVMEKVEYSDAVMSNTIINTDISTDIGLDEDVPLKILVRRKKNGEPNDRMTSHLKTDSVDIQENAIISPIQDSPLKRCGRRKKNTVPKDRMTRNLKISTDEIQKNTQEANICTTQDNVPMKRRGKKKKNVPNYSILNDLASTDKIEENSQDSSTGTNSVFSDNNPLKGQPKGKKKSTRIDKNLIDDSDTNTDVIKENSQETSPNCSSFIDNDLKDVNNESLLQERDLQSLTNNGSMRSTEMACGPSSDNINKSNESMLSDDEVSDISLSKLKSTIEKETMNEEILNTNESSLNSLNVTPSKRNSKMPVMSDFEYNIDSVLNKNADDKQTQGNKESDENLDILPIDSPKRPTRRKAQKTFHYDEDSDEDPFANIELSDDDEPRRGKKGYKYYSDYEYIPSQKRGKRKSKEVSLDSSDDDLEEYDLEELRKQKRKKQKISSPKKSKKSKKQNTEDTDKTKLPSNSTSDANCLVNDDIKTGLDTSVISTENSEEVQTMQTWGTTHEFENFLAKKIKGTELKIKKITATTSTDGVLTPLQIPVIDPKEQKKAIDTFSQTDIVKTVNISAQTTTPYAIKMKENVILTSKQSINACEFLKSVFTTTSELGQLMTQKSDDFVKKKITTALVKDTFKIGYCVEKSFLLLKLAKNNITQMEDDLSKQYEQFLRNNNLTACREEEKRIEAKAKSESGDSDCEIVETPVQVQPKQKPKFNPKTVFLNKELSIKIAKKSSTETKPKEKINVKGRHTVWINDSVMVKKVKPTQSFLAQDSRNKKPPDCFVTYKMVNDFFKSYYRQQALLTCAPFLSTEWLYTPRKEFICNYFVNSDELPNDPSCVQNVDLYEDNNNTENNNNAANNNNLNATKLLSSINMTNPRTLSTMCLEVLQKELYNSNGCKSDICYDEVVTINKDDQSDKLCTSTSPTDKLMCDFNKSYLCEKDFQETVSKQLHKKETLPYILYDDSKTNESMYKNEIKSLFSLCVKLIQTRELNAYPNSCVEQIHVPHTLKHITFIKMKHLLYDKHKKYKCREIKELATIGTKTVHKVKSLSDICFKLISTYYTKDICDNTNTDQENEMMIDNVNTLSEEAFLNITDGTDFDTVENYDSDGGYEPDYEALEEDLAEDNWVSQVHMEGLTSYNLQAGLSKKDDENKESNLDTTDSVVVQVKFEPIEEFTPHIKMEPETHYNQMTIIPESVCTKVENVEHSVTANLDNFEEFVRSNKLMFPFYEEPDIDGIFSQSALRIRRQHEPDSDNENEYDMSLLVPQTFGPMHLNNVRNSLMETSSGDENLSSQTVEKKKSEKKVKGRPKKTDPKNSKTLLTVNKGKEKIVNSDINIITRKMKDKIRQEQKKIQSSDSEEESVPLNNRKEKDISKVIDTPKKSLRSKKTVDDIQCNDVDSTEPDSIPDEHSKELNLPYQSENYEKSNDANSSPLISLNEPVELLECEPLLPMFENHSTEKSLKETQSNKTIELQHKEKNISYVERHGWNCYPVDSNDLKLYGLTQVLLHKLPEEFYDTYLKYKDINDKNKEDNEVDRLTNLQSLKRLSNVRDQKRKPKINKIDGENTLGSNSVDEASVADTYNSDHYDELTPSEDEGEKLEDQIPPAMQSEDRIAKNSLMNEEDSDPGETNAAEEDTRPDKKENIRTSPKKLNFIKPKIKEEHTEEELMLTADKMMNKELALLHAPVNLKQEIQENVDKESPSKDGEHKKKIKISNKNQTKRGHKSDNDSSSEEEKQWVNTKEKLLKRMGKKIEDNSIEDAKRTKIVNEFIEKRGDSTGRKSKNLRARPRRSYKHILEREKQMRVLSHELFGEISTFTGKKSSQSFATGRRNIRKVIDKKSLARSTVIANMEEFERKRRLNIRQNKLREVLGIEEGVNVVVINDEVCLEYDFVSQQPVVTIHPFFTKVMKAHQYEGVKFMWDACFECLSTLESGHPGGGCILAHCMGLGKTLQVLALLHTVLTHPNAGMKRVLVCCPLSTVLNWVDEIHKWIGPVTDKIKVFELSKLRKTYQRAYQLEDWYNGGGIFIIGYELFRSLSTLDPYLDNIRPTIVKKIRNALLDPGPDIVVCDEGHLLKNDCSVLAVAMSRVATKRRIVLTGTPMQNNLREYYCMVNFVKPNLLGTYSEYSNRFENPIMNGQHRDSREEDIKLMKARTHILHKVLEGCLQRQEASVLYPYLPKKHEYTVFISLTKCQWDLYKHYITNYANKHTRQNVLKDFHILQKIWSHPQVLHNFQMKARENTNDGKLTVTKVEKIEDELAAEDLVASEDIKSVTKEVWWLPYLKGGEMLNLLEASNKFVAVFSILDECVALGDKVLIFSTSLFTMDSLEYFLKTIKKWSLGTDYYRLDGTVPVEVRQKWCREFNAENNVNTKLFLVSTRAGCLGLNMVAANRVIILDTSWNPAHDIQSIFRVYRFGQKKDCYIYRLVALGTMEQKMYERSVTKQAVACRVVDEQQIDRHYNMAELTELYKFDEAGANVPGGVAVGVSDVALLRVARHSALHAVHEHDSLLRGSHERDLPEHERAAAWMQFQEEQAHKHFQNQLSYLPSVRPHGHDYAKPSGYMKLQQDYTTPPSYPQPSGSEVPQTITPEPMKQSQSTDETPDKSVKLEVVNTQLQPTNKFIPFKKCIIPIQRLPDPPPSNNSNQVQKVTTNNDLDETKVKKITNLLIEHNFQTRPQHEISELVAKIRKIVSEKQLHILEESSELVRSIACVMLGRDEEINFKNVKNKEKNRNKKKECEANDEFAPSTSKASAVKSVYSRKRKAALAAEQSISSLKSSVIDIVDLDDYEWAPSPAEVAPKSKQVHKVNDVFNHDKYHVSYEETLKAVQSITAEVPVLNMTGTISRVQGNLESILLSDDDEPLSRQKVDTNKTITNKKTKETNSESLFLHPSLLTNETFIKIVAQAYLRGNPMLDKDAATLAAKYSTGKVKAEFDKTGKPIQSGPIYDIALQVFGKDFLKKLNADAVSANNSLGQTKDLRSYKKLVTAEKSTAVIEKSAGVAEKPTTRYKPGPKSKKLQNAPTTCTSNNDTRQIQEIYDLTEIQTTPDAEFVKLSTIISTNQGDTARVVPVGMFKGQANVIVNKPFNPAASPRDECILPDDDFCVIDNNESALGTTNYLLPTPTTERNSQRLSSVLAGGRSTKGTLENPHYPQMVPNPTLNIASKVTGNIQPIMKTIEFTDGKLLLANTSGDDVTYCIPATQPQPTLNYVPTLQPTHLMPEAAVSAATTTICLDSDDEEAEVPTIHPDASSSLKTTAIPTNSNVPIGIQTSLSPNASILPDVHALKTKLKTKLASNEKLVHKKVFETTTSSSSTNSTSQNSPVAPQTITYGASVASQPVDATPSGSPQLMATSSAPFITSSAIPTSAVFSHSTPTPTDHTVSVTPQTINQTTVNAAPIMTETPLLRTQNITQATPSTPRTTMPSTSALLTPTDTNTLKSSLTKCKPGDILRINSSGQLELLNSNDKPVITEIQDSSSTSRKQTTSKITTEKTVEKNNITLDKRQENKAKNVLDSSSSSDESRSASPDPLSILKDVVHIPAAVYESPYRKQIPNFKTTSNRAALGFKDNKSVNKSAALNYKSNKTYFNTSSVPKKSSSSNEVLKSVLNKRNEIDLSKIKRQHIEQKKLKHYQLLRKNIDKTKSKTTTVTPSSNKQSFSKAKAIVDTVDLTNTSFNNSNRANTTKSTTPKATSSKSVVSKASGNSKATSTVIGTSKNIIIGGSGQLTKKTMHVKESSQKVTGAKNIPIKSETMKRPTDCVLATRTPKKKKTEHEMTLKDFDIDDLSDLDDIIELE